MKRPEEIDAERWRRVSGVVEVALELDRATRAAYLETLGRQDEDLRRRVLAILRSLGAIHSDEEATEGGVSSPESASEDRIGPWRLVRLLGRGGMGAVFLAERDDAEYERQVALKVIGSGFDAPIVYQRFLSERQILAGFDHPNIAKLYDAGTARDGRPYLVMEYIDGVPIDQYCFDNHLTVKERLDLFKKVCAAVSYAHRNLVVHRDLKPSNILVTPDGEPKLLDFGIAKLLDPANFPLDLEQTRTVHRPMTPNWASPEQLRGDPITTGTDVYALGLLLYKLLTGRLPHGPHKNVAAALVSLETPPTKPSQVLREIRGLPDRRLTWRKSERAKAKRELKGDLDNIVLKALRVTAGLKYSSAEALSADLGRLDASLPVSATSDTLAYTALRFGQRNRLTIAFLSVVLLIAGIFLRITLHQASAVREQTKRAQLERADAINARDRAISVRDYLRLLLLEIQRTIDKGKRIDFADLLEVAASEVSNNEELTSRARIDVLIVLSDLLVSANRDALAMRSLADAREIADVFNVQSDVMCALVEREMWILSGNGELDSARIALLNSQAAGCDPELSSSVVLQMCELASLRGEFLLTIACQQKLMKRLLAKQPAVQWSEIVRIGDLDGYAHDLAMHGYLFEGRKIVEGALRLEKWSGEATSLVNGALSFVQILVFSGDPESGIAICEWVDDFLSTDILTRAEVMRTSSYHAATICGLAFAKAGLRESAEQRLGEAIEMSEIRFSENPRDYRAKYFWGVSHLVRGQSRLGTDREKDILAALETFLPLMENDTPPVFVRNSYAIALMLANRLDEARPIVTELIEKGWRRPDFMALAEEKGVLPDPLPPRIEIDPTLPPEIQAMLDEAKDVKLPWEVEESTDGVPAPVN